MDEARAVLADVLSLGVELRAEGGSLRWRPAFLLRDPLLQRLREQKPQVVALLESGELPPRCPSCGWSMDAKARCPKCFDRRCVGCGRMTGSYFIATCVPCGQAVADGGRF